MSTINRQDFTQSLRGQQIDLQEASRDQALNGLPLAEADVDGDGVISGDAEAEALFNMLDDLDTNGDRDSFESTGGAGSAYRAIRSARQGRSSLTDFQNTFDHGKGNWRTLLGGTYQNGTVTRSEIEEAGGYGALNQHLRTLSGSDRQQALQMLDEDAQAGLTEFRSANGLNPQGRPYQISEERGQQLLARSNEEWANAPRSEVVDLQTFLDERGYDLGQWGVDGDFGSTTAAAADAARAERTMGPPAPENVTRAVSDERGAELLGLPDSHWESASQAEVTELQTYLDERGFDLGRWGVDGDFGGATQSALEQARQAQAAAPQPAAPTETPEAAPNAAPGGLQVPEERREALLSRPIEEWATASKAEVEELQTFLSERGYQVGVDGDWGGETRGALELAQRRERLLSAYGDTSSTGADWARRLSPLPKNMDNLLMSKLGMQTAITNDSLSEDQQLIVYETALRAMERTGDTVGGTSYADYGREEFHEFFNRGNVTSDAIMSSFSDDEFVVASTLGRFTYMQDPEDPDKVYVFDGYDWNPDEQDFRVTGGESLSEIVQNTEGDERASQIYRHVRNSMRHDQRENGESGADGRAFLVFSRSEMAALQAQRQAEQSRPAPADPFANAVMGP